MRGMRGTHSLLLLLLWKRRGLRGVISLQLVGLLMLMLMMLLCLDWVRLLWLDWVKLLLLRIRLLISLMLLLLRQQRRILHVPVRGRRSIIIHRGLKTRLLRV